MSGIEISPDHGSRPCLRVGDSALGKVPGQSLAELRLDVDEEGFEVLDVVVLPHVTPLTGSVAVRATRIRRRGFSLVSQVA